MMDQNDIDVVMTGYMEVIPEAMAMSMVALGNAMGHGNLEGVLDCLSQIDADLKAVVNIAAKVTASAIMVNEDEASGFEVPDDISGLEGM